MGSQDGTGRRFLFLQGPHGPFFSALARALTETGAACWRVGFNRGDAVFWRDRARYLPYTGQADDWPDACAAWLSAHAITDLVLYGDTRPAHAQAAALARAAGLRVHIFEEGYLRPYWVTYEREGANGHSPVMRIGLDRIRAAVAGAESPLDAAPARWGDMREHMFYGAAYHFWVLAANGRYAGFRPHRALTVSAEFRLYLRKLALLPLHALERALATRRIRRGGFPFHLVLLQLDHDASFRDHGPFRSTADFIDACLLGFAQGAETGDHLVFKAHPLDDGRVPLHRLIRARAHALGLGARVHFLRGGKLAPLLETALTAVTVNSTAGQQALWRGVPLCVFGAAVYARPELVSTLPLHLFLANPPRPDTAAYLDFRRFLLATSQIPGGFYARRSRRRLIPQAVALLLSDADPYQTAGLANAARVQQSLNAKS